MKKSSNLKKSSILKNPTIFDRINKKESSIKNIYSFLTLPDICRGLLLCKSINQIILKWGIPKNALKLKKELNLKKPIIKLLLSSEAKKIQKLESNYKIKHQDIVVIISYFLLEQLTKKIPPPHENNEQNEEGTLQENTLIPINFCNFQMGEKGIEYIAYTLSLFRNYDILNLSMNNLTNDKSPNLLKCMKNIRLCTNLKEINLSKNKIGDNTTKTLFISLILSNAPVTKINLNSNEISFLSTNIIVKFLKKNTTITHLLLGNNIIGEKGLSILCEGLIENNTLSHIDISFNGIGSKSFKSLFKVLSSTNTKIKSFNISGNYFEQEGFFLLSEALKQNNTLELLNISNNNVTNFSCYQFLSEAFETNNSLISLDLSHNILTEIAIQFITNGLTKANVIRNLILNDINLNEVTMNALIQGISQITTIKELSIGQNRIDKKTSKLLYTLISENKMIEIIDLSDCSIGNQIGFIGEGMKNNISITTLKLGRNRLDAGCIEILVKSLLDLDNNLISLSLEGNQFGDKGIEHLTVLISSDKSNINWFNLSSNNITNEGGNLLYVAMQKQNKRKRLFIENNDISKEIRIRIHQLGINNNNDI